MSTARRIVYLALGVPLIGGVGYCTYGFATAEGRVRQLCADISPGLPLATLRSFTSEHGLRSPPNSGVSYLMEQRSFGRYGCRVTIENGVVKDSVYSFAD
jgi:hypothetical protein